MHPSPAPELVDPDMKVESCPQMWKKYLPNAKVSYLEYDAACATKHKTDIEAQAGGTLYIGTFPRHAPEVRFDRSSAGAAVEVFRRRNQIEPLVALQVTRLTRSCWTRFWPTPRLSTATT